MSTSLAKINHTLEFLDLFKLRIKTDSDINDLKILRQTPAIAVIGLVSRGKSTLVNKLIGIDLLPTGPNPVTFGNGFLKRGPAKAIGRDKKGKSVELPTSPEEFCHRARRHDAQDIIDFEYTGKLRIPKNAMLIDTKGLDEVSTNFSDDLVELERSWASQGAMGAIMVTSVPPGMSAQDAMLFKSLNEHFRGNVVVVVKQTDSSLSQDEVEEAASVWNGHGADVLHISDLRPLNRDEWGSGPLSELETRISHFWSLTHNFKEDAATRLERSIALLAEEIKAPTSRASNREELLEHLWKALEDTKLLPSVRNIIRTRLWEFYSKSGSTPRDREELDFTLRYAEIDSPESINRLRDSLRQNSKLRSNIQFTTLIEILRSRIPKKLRQVLEYADIRSDDEYVAVSRLVDQIYSNGGDWDTIIKLCHKYSSNIKQEQRILQLMKLGGDLTARNLLSHLFPIWNSHLHDSRFVVSSDSFAIEVLSKKGFESISSDVSKNIQRLILEIEKISERWGEKELRAHQQRTDYDQSENLGLTSLMELKNRGDRISQILSRITYLAKFADQETQQLITKTVHTIGEGSKRQVWVRQSLTIAKHNEEFDAVYTTSFGWFAVFTGVITLFNLANEAYSWSIFFGMTTLFSWALWYLSPADDPVRLQPYTDNAELRSLESQLKSKFAGYGFLIILIAAITGIISAFIPNETENRDREISSSPSTFPSQNFENSSSTTSTISSATIEIIRSDDLLADLIQDGRGSEISIVSLPSDLSSQIGYAFRIRNQWSYLPNQLQVRYCWTNQEGVDFSCGDTTALRFSQVVDSVNYSLISKIDDSTPSGRYSLKVEFLEVNGSFISLSSIEINQETYTSTTSTLPYLTTRNRYWNADCPRNLSRNEILPLKLCQKGRGVQYVQQLLGVDDDGNFGNTTHNALLDFQYSRGLEPNGIVDSQTWLELDPNQGGPGLDVNGDGLVTPDEFN
jgi:hypothetical protein